MGLAQTIFNSIKEKYFSVWDIISLIEQKPNNDLFDIGLFLGHINIEEHISIYIRDKFYNLHEVDLNYNGNPLGEIIDCLMDIMPFDSDEEQQNGRSEVRSKSEHLFFAKQDIYNFNPIMDLGFIEKPATQVVKVQSIQEVELNDRRKFFLYKQHLFSINECACIISDYDPLEIQKYPHNDIDEIAPDYSRAYSFIGSAIEANKLNVFNYKVDADDFREYLASENIIIAGFNDQIAEPLYKKPTQARAEFEKINASLELDLAIEKNKVEKLNEEISHLKAHIAELESKKMQYPQKENAINEDKINIANSDLLLIAALMTTLRSEIKVKGKNSQAKVLQRIEDEHGSIKGLSKSRTEKVLASANSLYKALINNQMK
jgi:cell division protein FtsB